MYNDGQLHPKHKYIIAQMALKVIPTNSIQFYADCCQILEYGATCIELSDVGHCTRQSAYNHLAVLMEHRIVVKCGSKYTINKGCVTDKHLVAGMNALGYM